MTPPTRFVWQSHPGGFNEISLARRAKVFGDNNKGWTEVLVWLSNYAESAV
jgi:hypothetical protein